MYLCICEIQLNIGVSKRGTPFLLSVFACLKSMFIKIGQGGLFGELESVMREMEESFEKSGSRNEASYGIAIN